EPGHVPQVAVIGDGVEGVIPIGQQLSGLRVEVASAVLVPNRQVVTLEPHGVCRGPPHLVVGGGDDLPQPGPRDGAADSDVHMRCEPFCGSMVAKYCTS